jgi:hypothetical protein
MVESDFQYLGQTQFRLLKAAEILAMPMEGCA